MYKAASTEQLTSLGCFQSDSEEFRVSLSDHDIYLQFQDNFYSIILLIQLRHLIWDGGSTYHFYMYLFICLCSDLISPDMYFCNLQWDRYLSMILPLSFILLLWHTGVPTGFRLSLALLSFVLHRIASEGGLYHHKVDKGLPILEFRTEVAKSDFCFADVIYNTDRDKIASQQYKLSTERMCFCLHACCMELQIGTMPIL